MINRDILGEHTIWIDCDVIQADGGTRTTAITGSFVALVDALRRLKEKENWERLPISDYVAAVSVGKVEGEIMLDLCYAEDSLAEVDMNVVMTGSGRFVEIQGTAEESTFTREELQDFLNMADKGIKQLIAYQKELLGELDD